MSAIIDSVIYILDNYPCKGDLSNARVTKMLYLADWYCAINNTPPVTTIDWYFDSHGPFVWDVKDAVARSAVIDIDQTVNQYGTPKNLFRRNENHREPILTASDKIALDHVIEQTKNLYWSDFITLVYSTYPIVSSPKYSNLNLVKKADEYRNEIIQNRV